MKLNIKEKKCSRCKETKPVEEFYLHKRSSDGYHSYCKKCGNDASNEWHKNNPEKGLASARKWHKDNPDKVKNIRLKREYGITLSDYNRMWSNQEGSCAICGVSGLVRKLFVDHDHKTGKVRGLLCAKHNFLLGYANDDVNILFAASKYLLKFQDIEYDEDTLRGVWEDNLRNNSLEDL
jgi:hypothetical protein